MESEALARAVWGGGETPALKGLVEPSAIILAGSAIGLIAPKSLRITGDVRDGDHVRVDVDRESSELTFSTVAPLPEIASLA